MWSVSINSPVRSRPLALATLLGILFLTFLDTTIVTVILGEIQFELGAGVIPLQWVVNGYALPFAALMLLAGSLGDRFGRKYVMIAGIVVFVAGSLLSALAATTGALIAGRAVMGIGAAASEPGTLSVLRHLYPDSKQRARAIGAWAATSGVGLALGPVIGGLLASLHDWRMVFWFNVALGVLLLVAALRWVPRSRDQQAGAVDVGGFIVGALALGSLVFAAMFGEQYGYTTPWVLALFVIGVVAALALIAIERRAANPMISGPLLGRRGVADALFGAFAIYFGIFSIFFFTALYLDLVEGYSGLKLAALFGPMAAAIVVGSLTAGRWVGKVGTATPIVAGSLISAAGIIATRYVLTASPVFTQLIAALILAGVGFGMAVVPVTAAVLGRVPAAHSGMAAGATNTARQLGAVIGVTVLGALVSSTITRGFGADMDAAGIPDTIKEPILTGFQFGGERAKGIDFANPDAFSAPLINSAASAFRDGIYIALWVSAALIVASAALTAIFGRDHASEERQKTS